MNRLFSTCLQTGERSFPDSEMVGMFKQKMQKCGAHDLLPTNHLKQAWVIFRS
jgi:hypothetical protein